MKQYGLVVRTRSWGRLFLFLEANSTAVGVSSFEALEATSVGTMSNFRATQNVTRVRDTTVNNYLNCWLNPMQVFPSIQNDVPSMPGFRSLDRPIRFLRVIFIFAGFIVAQVILSNNILRDFLNF